MGPCQLLIDQAQGGLDDDDSLDIRRLDDYGAEPHNLLKGDVCY
jgi:hypothetical protein